MRARKIYEKLLVNPQNVRFADFSKVVEASGNRRDRIMSLLTGWRDGLYQP
jgi:hypothetical protein